MKLLKAKAFLHGLIGVTSVGLVLLMLVESTRNIYPDVICYICAGISAVNAIYSALLLVGCTKEMNN